MEDGIKCPSISEAKNRHLVCKSLVVMHAILIEVVFTEAYLTDKRPGIGLSPMLWNEILGRKVPRSFDTDELIEL